MRSAVAITALVCLTLSWPVSAAQRTSQDLQGRLTVKNRGAAPPFVWLRLEELGATIREAAANDGRFAFPDLLPGRYTIVADAPGFEKASVNIDFPFDRFVSIELKPSRQEQSRAEVANLSDFRIPKSARRQFAAGKKKVEENRCQEAFD